MGLHLVLREKPTGATKDVGENVFLANLSHEYQVYLFYYPAEMLNSTLEQKLRELGDQSGKNLFVNIGRLNDPQLGRIVKMFDIRSYPVIVLTAVAPLAAPKDEYASAYVRLDSKHMLKSPNNTVECVKQIYSLFLQGNVAEAMSKAKWTQRAELAKHIGGFITHALKAFGDFIAERDIVISFAEGKLELKKSGD